MALVGNIRDFSLSDFLYLVDRGYKTGCLHLSRLDENGITVLRERPADWLAVGEQAAFGDGSAGA
ncbi:MAG: hypothetical protein U0Z44_03305 [Kouleothrix sp.]